MKLVILISIVILACAICIYVYFSKRNENKCHVKHYDIEEIKKCNTINDYLNLLGKRRIDDMTFEEIADWIHAEKMSVITKVSFSMVEDGFLDHYPDKEKVTSLLKQALRENREFECAYIMNESCDGSNVKDYTDYFDMGLCDKN